MRTTIRFLSWVALASLTAGISAGVALGADEASSLGTKSAPIYHLLDGAYGSIEYRHNYDLKYAPATPDRLGVTPKGVIRPTIGAKWFDDRLDASVTFKFARYANQVHVKQETPEAWVQFDAYRGETLTVSPVAWVFLPYAGGNKGTDAYIGSQQVVKAPAIDTPAGALNLSAEATLWAVTGSRPKDATYANQSGLSASEATDQFGLSAGDKPETLVRKEGQSDLNYATGFAAAASLSPIKPVTVETKMFLDQSFDPAYTIRDAEGTVQTTYQTTNVTYQRLRLSYAVTDKLSLVNDFYAFQGGIFETRYNSDNQAGNTAGARYINQTRVVYSL